VAAIFRALMTTVDVARQGGVPYPRCNEASFQPLQLNERASHPTYGGLSYVIQDRARAEPLYPLDATT
jgi:hypothetical protein